MHPGSFPTDWVKPSGMEENRDYRTVPTMLTSMKCFERVVN